MKSSKRSIRSRRYRFQAVQKSLRRVLRGENAGTVAEEDHGAWWREMFAPSATAGLLRLKLGR